jgi:hypothetical protein
MKFPFSAYHAHSLLNVGDVARIYDVDEFGTAADFRRLLSGTGPVIVPMWGGVSSDTERPVTEAGEIDQNYTALFWCLIGKTTEIPGLHVALPAAIEVEWAYRRALAHNADLDNTLAIDAQVNMTRTTQNIGDDEWYMIEITHQWRVLESDQESEE